MQRRRQRNKGKKVIIRTDIWKSIKNSKGNAKDIKKRSYSNLKSKKLLKIYLTVKQPKKILYPPVRKSYNIHTFG